VRLGGLASEKDHTGEGKDIGGNVEKTIPHDIEFQVPKAADWKACAGKHMMPLQNLMEDDPIEKPAQPYTKKNAAKSGKATFSISF
jgi:hypothetical protein